ncbi:cuticle protein AM1199-like isoform X3 [Homarus americanus]|uniref:Cuticle protein n=1 Tax=Homarus americanus TaxID=6706 RepID=A0A8J5T8Z2_HOMAM|nr:cuticle protein AM1199-like isoform X1 [Homarus americanus]XP_042213574.1 cuticle protein AM1199-like isoform X3 [Homarus americanus]KAG7173491.1 Cuticle protein [Homarus americanus]
MFSKLVLCVLVAVVAAKPQGGYEAPQQSYTSSGPVVPIVKDERQGPDADGNYNFDFETGDGISRQEQGAPHGETGAVAAQGGWAFKFPDGSPGIFNFVADAAGYKVQSDLLPTPHPLPAHAIQQIEFARQQEAAGPGPQYGSPPTPGYN